MVLSDKDIRKALARGAVSVNPMPLPQRFQPASLELTLAGEVEPHGTSLRELIVLEPGEFRLATTVETVKISGTHVAQVNGKSSLGRLGLLVHATAGFIDPGFHGQITLELKNLHHARPVYLTAGMPICQLVFSTLTSIPSRLYGDSGLGSHYQNQVGVTPSWMETGVDMRGV